MELYKLQQSREVLKESLHELLNSVYIEFGIIEMAASLYRKKKGKRDN